MLSGNLQQNDVGSQIGPRLANRPGLRAFFSSGKPRRFAGTSWWRTQSSQTGLPDKGKSLASGNFAGKSPETRLPPGQAGKITIGNRG
jgi:hypothetical protein